MFCLSYLVVILSFVNLINFILFVQWHKGPKNISKDALCHNHFLAILCVFSGLYLANNMLMTTSANEFYSTGPVLLTFQDALSPMEQVFFTYIIDLHQKLFSQFVSYTFLTNMIMCFLL
jgi:ethylene-insensitive protein 2